MKTASPSRRLIEHVASTGRMALATIGSAILSCTSRAIEWAPSLARLTTKELSKIMVVLSSVSIVAGLTCWTLSDVFEARREAEVRLSAAVVALSDIMHWSLVTLRGVVQPLGAKIENEGLEKLGSVGQLAELNRFAEYLPKTGQLFVTNKEGEVIASAPNRLPSPLNLRDREWFRALQNGASGIYIGRALKGRRFHDLIFPVAVAFRTIDGTFFGAVEIRVEMDFFAHIADGLGVGPNATVGLYRTADGAVVARSPMTEALLDESIATLPYFSTLTTSGAESWLGWIQSDVETHLVAARRLHNWPLIVSVSLTRGEIYSRLWRPLLWRSAVAALLVAVLSALALRAVRQSRREIFLIGELEHRVKNTLAVVGTVIDRAREDCQTNCETLSSLRGRIQSMADTQTLLGRSRWEGVTLRELILTELKPYANGINTVIVGPAVQLSPDASRAVGMVIHELTTNAAKYGALSRLGGQVSVLWTLESMLKIQWTETGGPAVAAPARQGYGIGVIRNLLTYEFGGRVDLVFADQGLCCTMELPVGVGRTIS
jgi:two-component sensor histidine kinase